MKPLGGFYNLKKSGGVWSGTTSIGAPTRFCCRGAELHLSLFGLVQSCVEGLGLGEADMLPQTLRHQSPQEGVERQGLSCSRGGIPGSRVGSSAGHQQHRPPGSPPPCGVGKPATAGSGCGRPAH
ncbi:unnamed protein product [Gadus morhua 'NCC']